MVALDHAKSNMVDMTLMLRRCRQHHLRPCSSQRQAAEGPRRHVHGIESFVRIRFGSFESKAQEETDRLQQLG